MEMLFNVMLVDDKGKNISHAIELLLPGFTDVFLAAYDEGAKNFNSKIGDVNKDFDKLYPDHKIDLDDENDLYINYIREVFQPFYDKLTIKYFGSMDKVRFGLYAEMANFALRFSNGYTVSFVLKEIKK